MSADLLPDLVLQLTPSSSEDGDSMRLQQMDDEELNILEVYDQATFIRKEFQRLAEICGADAIRSLVPPVNRLVELLESQVIRQDKYRDEILEMKKFIHKLQTDQYDFAALKKKYREELDAIDNQWRDENETIMKQLAKLEDENRRLQKELENHPSDRSEAPETVCFTREEIQTIEKVTDQNTQMKAQLRLKEKELKRNSAAIESMQAQLNTIGKINTTLKRANFVAEHQIKQLNKEKLELEVQLTEKENCIRQMTEKLNEEKETLPMPSMPSTDELNKELAMLDMTHTGFSVDIVRQIIWEKIESKNKLMEAEDEIQVLKEQLQQLTSPPPPPPEPVLVSTKSRSIWPLFLFFPIVICFEILQFCWRVFHRSNTTGTSAAPSKRRGSMSQLEHSSLASPIVQSGVLMSKTSLPLRSPSTSFSQD